MHGMNRNRILAGGVLAGVVALVLEFVGEAVFRLDWAAWLAGLGLPAPGGMVMAYFLIGSPLVGILAVWIYAAMRPRYGPGPATAIRAGLVVWALACLFPTASLAAYGLLPMDAHFWVPALYPAVQWPLSTLAGARIYRENEPIRVGARVAAGA